MSESSRVVDRHDRHVTSDPGIEIFVREVRAQGEKQGVPLLLVHGGGPGGLESFDLPVPGYSLAEDLATAGHVVYVMDVRGWARSTRPLALEEPPERHPPAVRADEAERDIAAVAAAIRRDERRPIALLGWASGAQWSAQFAARHPDAVTHLVLLNGLYGVDAPWSLRSAFEAPGHPGEFDATAGAYTVRTAASLLFGWDRSIPTDDKSVWREPDVAAAYVEAALASDPRSTDSDPPAMRVPNGYQVESYELSTGRRFWEARDLRAHTLVVRGELDFWSRKADLDALLTEAVNAATIRTITIPGATHYLFNDRPDRGRNAFIHEVLRFLARG
jgi:pimeloyl-ACP methyl ester carboxylesterase